MSAGAPKPVSKLAAAQVGIEITRFFKLGGNLTKEISLKDGRLMKDSSKCKMAKGEMFRVKVTDLDAFATLIENLPSQQAIALGAMRDALGNQATVRTKDSPRSKKDGYAARTKENVSYREGEPALALLDHDTRGMPRAVQDRLEAVGGFVNAITSVIPEFDNAGYVRRLSTSAGLFNSETDEHYPSGGEHDFVLVKDGADIPRFLDTLHGRAWLAGYGWLMVSKAGQLLDRSIIDKSVAAPERLVFEGAPKVNPPIKQDPRPASVRPGAPLDTKAAVPDLTPDEKRELARLKEAAARPLAKERAGAKKKFIEERAAEGVARGQTPEQAKRTAEYWGAGVLLPGVVLTFSNPEIGQRTVAEVLADPDRFDGEPLADPIEGVEYGPETAKVLRHFNNGALFVHSFAHGGLNYSLRHDFASVKAAITKAKKADAAKLLARLMLIADCDPIEENELIKYAGERTGAGVRPVAEMLKLARLKQRRNEAQARREAHAATSGKVMLHAPRADAEIGPVMAEWDAILCAIQSPEPPMRDLAGWPVRVLEREPVGSLHELTSKGVNDGDDELSRLPAPKLTLLTRHDVFSIEHALGDYITLFRETDMGDIIVAPEPRFVNHTLHFAASSLPKVGTVLTMPLILPDGTLLARRGLDRERKLIMRCDPALLSFIPEQKDCDAIAVLKAIEFLLDDWFVDVAGGLQSKCVLLAIALCVIERVLLPERPVFAVTAGQRSSGKTTVIKMLILAILGVLPPAAAWARSEDERRKALLAYLLEGLPVICWDNIGNGTTISSPAFEKISTSETYSDRILGVSETATAPCYMINVFTGNNIKFGGGLASRFLDARLTVDRPDPQNRTFVHSDPIKWTRDHRGEILRALYTILLGNPQLDLARAGEPRTRFKAWWSLIGSAIEHASDLYLGNHPRAASDVVDFRRLFDAGDAEDEEVSETGDVLEILDGLTWRPKKKEGDKNEFDSADVFARLGATTGIYGEEPRFTTLRQFFTKGGLLKCSSLYIGRGLAGAVDQPIQRGNVILTLRRRTLDGRPVYRLERRFSDAQSPSVVSGEVG